MTPNSFRRIRPQPARLDRVRLGPSRRRARGGPRLLVPFLTASLGALQPALVHAQCQLQKLTVSDVGFGNEVALERNVAFVSKTYGSLTAKVYAFEPTPSGWVETQVLTVPGIPPSDLFGISLDVQGRRLVAGASGDSSTTLPGAAYVFQETDGAWIQSTKLVASDGVAAAHFGTSVGVWGDTVLVGAPNQETFSIQNTGAAYVFELQDALLVEIQILAPLELDPLDLFGRSLSIQGSTAAIAAIGDDDGGDRAGAVYIFEKVAGAWVETQKLTASDPSPVDLFGSEVSLHGDTLAIGAYGVDEPVIGCGAVYIFERRGSTWVETAKLSPDPPSIGSWFGNALQLLDGALVVGARLADTSVPSSGAAYFFERSDGPAGQWTQTGIFLADEPTSSDYLGGAVALSRDLVLVNASGDDDLAFNSGAAYLYPRPDVAAAVLEADLASISLSQGGSQTLTLQACPASAGDAYVLAGTTAGTSPGLTFGDFVIPLNPSRYLDFTLLHPETPPLEGFQGAFDASGTQTASVSIPPGTDPTLVGTILHHSFLLVDTTQPAAVAVSHASPLELVP